MSSTFTPGTILTSTGRIVRPLALSPDDVDVRDIAHALSNQCRYAGHIPRFYSTAQHSVLVSYACPPHDALWGLLHDAAEAYLVDVPKPLKVLSAFVAYRDAEANAMLAICQHFQLDPAEPPWVGVADRAVFYAEDRDLRGNCNPPALKASGDIIYDGRITVMKPRHAERMFLSRFALLQRCHGTAVRLSPYDVGELVPHSWMEAALTCPQEHRSSNCRRHDPRIERVDIDGRMCVAVTFACGSLAAFDVKRMQSQPTIHPGHALVPILVPLPARDFPHAARSK